MTKNERIREMLSEVSELAGALTFDPMVPVSIQEFADKIYDKVGDIQTMLDQPDVSEHPNYGVLVQTPGETRLLRHDGRTAFNRNEAEALAASVNWDTSHHLVGQIAMTYESTVSDSELREEYM